ncbi:MAG: chemotaxis protein CheW, partial [Myxococcales bacterium]|nr:chemotaxis protein CheW [Myxococcales bacterium]
DVVRSNLQAIGGAVEVQSQPAVGTTVRLKIPLTLAILPALVVRCRGLDFAVPQAHLVELIDLKCGTGHAVEELGGAPVLRRRGELLPLAYLDHELGLVNGPPAHEFVVVVRADDVTYGLCVDAVEETEEIVVKPLGPELESVKAFSGATVRGDGSIALILDIVQLAKSSNAGRTAAVVAEEADEAGERTTLLRFDLVGTGVGAVEVDHVIRIEDVTADDLHRHGEHYYLDFNGKVVPVVDLVGIKSLGRAAVALVVCRTARGPVAVAVSEVLDVVDVPLELAPGLGGGWAAGMALVEGRSTAILDLQRLSVA